MVGPQPQARVIHRVTMLKGHDTHKGIDSSMTAIQGLEVLDGALHCYSWVDGSTLAGVNILTHTTRVILVGLGALIFYIFFNRLPVFIINFSHTSVFYNLTLTLLDIS